VTLGNLDNPGQIEPKLEMFTKRRLEWVAPLDCRSLRGCRVEWWMGFGGQHAA
jgi:hypothetical protein